MRVKLKSGTDCKSKPIRQTLLCKEHDHFDASSRYSHRPFEQIDCFTLMPEVISRKGRARRRFSSPSQAARHTPAAHFQPHLHLGPAYAASGLALPASR